MRKSLKTISGDTAIENAKALATEIDEARLTGRDARWFTLGQIFGEYSRLKAPNLLADRRKAGATRKALFKMAWGSDRVVLDVSQTDADRFMRLRRSGELVPNRGGRTMEGVRDGTIDGDFRWLSSVFDWARKHKKGAGASCLRTRSTMWNGRKRQTHCVQSLATSDTRPRSRT
ncbi:MAG TPA: hypothetical protein EYQ27_14460 [Gemmatimonadetes bacterium]|nr:hypothetical protein [Gemmatimonadota bacterium]